MALACVNRWQLLDHLFGQLQRGHGGWLVTANLDFLRRYAIDDGMRQLYDAADLRVADGMPLVWASRLQGSPLPERIAGSTLASLIAERAAKEGRCIYLLGGAPGAAQGACSKLRQQWPAIDVSGVCSPLLDSPPTDEQVAAAQRELAAVRPDIVLIGLGSPKQEQLAIRLRDALPASWFVGVGVTFSFLAGELRRAPPWLRRVGLEWTHRLAQEPRRLAKRYLIDDLPFAFRLLARATLRRGSDQR